ncbi:MULTISPECIES: ATP-binding protein [unclassified Paludibacterium]|uniref:ATP-binding protein n=1 Tax=unclassified Paludibacterium TaxID=2618429 RepID=UPI001C041300|nr:ATP-binding protein [Paludibacterium sp. B53371]BEV70945.1 hypothetical protein THUN1379_04270 [Paludibacterium sp. THUN1379]
MLRLFSRFILAFWLAFIAIALTAGATAGLIRHYHPQWLAWSAPPGNHAPPPPLNTFATLLQAGQLDSVRLLLQNQSGQHHPALRILSADGQAMPGSASGEVVEGQWQVSTPSGQRYTLQWLAATPSSSPPHGPPPPPWLLIVIAMLVSLGFSAGLAWTMLRPVRLLRQALRDIASGQLETRISERMGHRRDELAALAQDFDQMAWQLQQQIGAQQRLLHDVSHELRSPLARLQAVLGLLQQHPQQLDSALRRIEREIERLDNLVDEVLTLARLESGVATSETTVDVMDLLSEIAADAAFEGQARDCRVSLQASGSFVRSAQAALLHRSLENVVRNAVRFAPAGSTIELRAEQDATGLQILVRDHGPGVAPSELEAIFSPFYRGTQGHGDGYGLGLAIARRAIEGHGGQIRAFLPDDGGLAVAITLPR